MDFVSIALQLRQLRLHFRLFRFWEELERVRLEQARQQAIREKLKQISPCPAGFNWHLGRDIWIQFWYMNWYILTFIILTGSIINIRMHRWILMSFYTTWHRFPFVLLLHVGSKRLFWGTRPRVDGAVAVVRISSPMSSGFSNCLCKATEEPATQSPHMHFWSLCKATQLHHNLDMALKAVPCVLVCCLLSGVVELANWLDVHKAAKAICSLKYADGWVLMSP